jgi:hypothetical protein
MFMFQQLTVVQKPFSLPIRSQFSGKFFLLLLFPRGKHSMRSRKIANKNNSHSCKQSASLPPPPIPTHPVSSTKIPHIKLTNGKSGLIFDISVQSPKNFKKAGRSILFFGWGVAMRGGGQRRERLQNLANSSSNSWERYKLVLEEQIGCKILGIFFPPKKYIVLSRRGLYNKINEEIFNDSLDFLGVFQSSQFC